MEEGPISWSWAAGFFDGEGSTVGNNGANKSQITLNIDQNDPEVLIKFKDSIGGLGSITGPYYRRKNPYWTYRSNGPCSIVILGKLWPYLSTLKKIQAEKVLIQVQIKRAWRKPENVNI